MRRRNKNRTAQRDCKMRSTYHPLRTSNVLQRRLGSFVFSGGRRSFCCGKGAPRAPQAFVTFETE